MSVLNSSLLLGQESTGPYQVQRSLRFNAADSAYLSRTPGSAGNRKTWTFSCWVKRSGLSSTQLLFHAYSATNDSGFFDLRFDASDRLEATLWNIGVIQTTQVFRDVSAWYHIVLAVDTTQSTANDRMRMYVNGSEITAFGVNNRGSISNSDLAVNSTAIHNIGRKQYDASAYFSGYLAECYLIDGQQLTPSSFGETDTNGQWQPKAYSGSYGTNGFRLTFSDNSGTTATTLGKDAAGSNNWTPNNFSVATGAGNDSLVDTPSSYGTGNSGGDVRGNYATLNPLDLAGGTPFSLANGNLEATFTNGSQTAIIVSTIFVSSGKWYAEFTPTTLGANSGTRIGVQKNVLPRTYLGGDAGNYAYQLNGNKQNNASSVAYGSSYTINDVIGVALDMDAGTITYYKNGVSQGQAYSGLSGEYTFAYTDFGNGAFVANFGQRPFAYPVSGFKALCDTSLPTPTIIKPSTVFDTTLYTGNGSTQNITGLGFSPDFVWIKARSQPYSNTVFDAIRGATNYLYTDTTSAEATNAQFLTAFNSDGFSLGTNAAVNQSSTTYAAWIWDAGSSNSTNNAGSITSTVRANTSAGFSIVTYTGSAAGTVGHGLGVAPALIISKQRNVVNHWPVYHSALGTSQVLELSSTSAAQSSSNYWGSSVTSTTFGTGPTSAQSNANGNIVAYCFAPVAGYSSMSSFVGNGSSDGVFVYTGFRPRYLFIKRSDSTGDWRVYDTARSPYNTAGNDILFNSSQADADLWPFDILSNGFKIRTSDVRVNASNGTFIYAAFAESPFQYARAR